MKDAACAAEGYERDGRGEGAVALRVVRTQPEGVGRVGAQTAQHSTTHHTVSQQQRGRGVIVRHAPLAALRHLQHVAVHRTAVARGLRQRVPGERQGGVGGGGAARGLRRGGCTGLGLEPLDGGDGLAAGVAGGELEGVEGSGVQFCDFDLRCLFVGEEMRGEGNGAEVLGELQEALAHGERVALDGFAVRPWLLPFQLR